MLIEYNGKKKGSARLPMNKLYAKENALFAGIDETDGAELPALAAPKPPSALEESPPIMDQQELLNYFDVISPFPSVSQRQHAI